MSSPTLHNFVPCEMILWKSCSNSAKEMRVPRKKTSPSSAPIKLQATKESFRISHTPKNRSSLQHLPLRQTLLHYSAVSRTLVKKSLNKRKITGLYALLLTWNLFKAGLFVYSSILLIFKQTLILQPYVRSNVRMIRQ